GIRKGERKPRILPASSLPPACRSCGVLLPDGREKFCSDCLPGFLADQRRSFSAAGRAGLRQLRAQGKDPSQSPEAKGKIGAANARKMRDVRRWDRQHERPDGCIFVRELLPALHIISLRRLAAATGWSLQLCALVRLRLRLR